jgi:hypothetical protein
MTGSMDLAHATSSEVRDCSLSSRATSRTRLSWASISGACAYAISTRCCAACRERALDLSGLSFQRVLPCVRKNSISSCVDPDKFLLPSGPLFWYVSFENLEPADLDDGVSAIRIVRVAGEKPDLDTLYDFAAYVGCSGCPLEVSL